MTSTLPPTGGPELSNSDRGAGPGIHLGALMTGSVFLLIGCSWMLEMLDIVDVRWSLLFPASLVVVGSALVLGARHARTGGLVALGLVLLVAALFASTFRGLDVSFRGPIGDHVEHPTAVDQLARRYSVSAGSMRLDLTGISAEEYDGVRRVRVDVGMGDMRIIVPDDVAVRLEADVGMGEAKLFEESISGVGVSRDIESSGYPSAEARLEIRGHIGMGNLRVVRG